MAVKAVYQDGVLKPKEPLPFKEHEEVEIDVRRPAGAALNGGDPRSFVGFIKNAPEGVPLARRHDLYLDQEQYGHMKDYLRPLLALPEWEGLGQEEKLRRFVRACKEIRPDLIDLWDGMDRVPFMCSDALDYCTRAIRRDGGCSPPVIFVDTGFFSVGQTTSEAPGPFERETMAIYTNGDTRDLARGTAKTHPPDRAYNRCRKRANGIPDGFR